MVGRWVGEPVVYIGVRRAEESHHRLHCSTLLYTALHWAFMPHFPRCTLLTF